MKGKSTKTRHVPTVGATCYGWHLRLKWHEQVPDVLERSGTLIPVIVKAS